MLGQPQELFLKNETPPQFDSERKNYAESVSSFVVVETWTQIPHIYRLLYQELHITTRILYLEFSNRPLQFKMESSFCTFFMQRIFCFFKTYKRMHSLNMKVSGTKLKLEIKLKIFHSYPPPPQSNHAKY